MQVFGYFDLTSKKMLSSIRGTLGGDVNLPTMLAGETLRFNIRFRESRDGSSREIAPNVRAMKAAIGRVDTPPLRGKFKLEIDGTPTEYIELTGEADEDFAAKIKTAIMAALTLTSGQVSVEKRDGSYIITFPESETTEREWEVLSNRLYPRSFVRIRSYEKGDAWEHELRMVQSPVAFASTFERETGPVPIVDTLRDGGEVDNSKWSEIQSLYLPPQFPGTIRLKRGEVRSDVISPKQTVAQIAAALKPIAEPGGTFVVTNPVDYHVYIEFSGDMVGTNYDPLTVEIFDGPEPDYVVSLDTKTREMADLMMGTDGENLILEIHAEIEDPDDEGSYSWHNLYRRQVAFREAVDWDELATAPAIDWLKPPTFVSYRPFSPNQVSNGQLHYTTEEGDGVATVFALAHGLNTDTVQVIITENASPGQSYRDGEHFTWVRNNANLVTVTWLGDVPAANSLLITILGLAQTSFFDPHTHEIDDVNGLREWMTLMEARVSRLERVSGGTISVEADEGAEIARWQFPGIFELYPSRVTPTRPDSGRLSDVDLTERDENQQLIVNRGRGLLPAVHDATVEALPSPVPSSPFTPYVGKVYENTGDESVLVTTGMGNRTRTVKPGEFVACYERGFYPVAKYDEYENAPVSVSYSVSNTLWTFTDEDAEMLPAGTVVQLVTTGTLPGASAAATNYTIVGPNFQERTFELKKADGTILEVTSNGTGTHSLTIPSKTTFYSRHYERTLFEIPINEDQLRYRTKLEVAIAFELAVLKSNTKAQWAIMFEIGEFTSVEGAANSNLKEVVWRKLPIFEKVLHLTSSSTTHRFGLRIYRRLLDDVDTITAEALVYGAIQEGLVPPKSANFLLRARLGKFDTEDSEPDPLGLVIVSGLAVQPLSETNSEIEYGYAVID